MEPELIRLADACRAFIDDRFPTVSGDDGAAAMLLEDGRILIGTAPEVPNYSVELCHEVEPFCAAYRLQERVVASICLCRETADRFVVLSPCGVCRERLAQHGPDVMCAVADRIDPTVVTWKKLRDIHLDYWATPFLEGDEAAGWGGTTAD